ncbi:MAG: MFS transporter [Acidobacteriota bacterium]
MKLKKARMILIISVIAQILVVLGFTGALNVSSFRANYADSLVNSYAVVGSDAVRNIEYAVKYGKPLDNLYGIENLLQDVKRNATAVQDVRVCLPDGRYLYGLNGSLKSPDMPDAIKNKIKARPVKDSRAYFAVPYGGRYHVFLPLTDRQGRHIGFLNMIFDQKYLDGKTALPMRKTVEYLFVIALAAIVCAVAVFVVIDLLDESGNVKKVRLMAAVLIILGIAQMAYAILNFNMFKGLYIDIAQENARLTARIVQRDVGLVLEKGVPFDKLYDIDSWMKKIVISVPEINHISIMDHAGKPVYQTVPVNDTDQDVSMVPLISEGNKRIGSISVALSSQNIRDRIINIALDAVTVMVLSVFFMVEITLFLMFFIQRKIIGRGEGDQGRDTRQQTPAEPASRAELIRPLAFIFFIATSMSVSYIPLMMKELYKPLLGLPQAVIIGLPISFELLCSSLAIILTGYLVDKRGWKAIFYFGLAILGIGLLLSALASNAVIFILARGVVGAGYGLCWMAMRSYCTNAPSMAEKTEGLSAYNAGMFAGFNCGIAIGAMLAERIGYNPVFFVGLAMIVVTAGLGLVMAGRDVQTTNVGAEPGKLGLLGFLFNTKVLGFLVLITIPLAVSSMFMDYFFPLYGASIDLSPSNIGRGFLLYGLCIVYLGPVLSMYFEQRIGVKMGTAISAFLFGAALIVFAVWGTLMAALAAILMLGIADSFGVVVQNNYLLSLEASEQMGQNKAVGYYSMVRKMGQTAGPFIFGSLAVLGQTRSVLWIGAVSLICLIIFLAIVRGDANEVAGGLDV